MCVKAVCRKFLFACPQSWCSVVVDSRCPVIIIVLANFNQWCCRKEYPFSMFRFVPAEIKWKRSLISVRVFLTVAATCDGGLRSLECFCSSCYQADATSSSSVLRRASVAKRFTSLWHAVLHRLPWASWTEFNAWSCWKKAHKQASRLQTSMNLQPTLSDEQGSESVQNKLM